MRGEKAQAARVAAPAAAYCASQRVRTAAHRQETFYLPAQEAGGVRKYGLAISGRLTFQYARLILIPKQREDYCHRGDIGRERSAGAKKR